MKTKKPKPQMTVHLVECGAGSGKFTFAMHPAIHFHCDHCGKSGGCGLTGPSFADMATHPIKVVRQDHPGGKHFEAAFHKVLSDHGCMP